jgi:hypothetical protein
MTFTQQDKDALIKFLNYVAQKADFKGVSLSEQIECFKNLNQIQTSVLAKIDSHLLEVVAVKEVKAEKTKK